MNKKEEKIFENFDLLNTTSMSIGTCIWVIALFLLFTCSGGVNIITILFACCCPCCYILYYFLLATCYG